MRALEREPCYVSPSGKRKSKHIAGGRGGFDFQCLPNPPAGKQMPVQGANRSSSDWGEDIVTDEGGRLLRRITCAQASQAEQSSPRAYACEGVSLIVAVSSAARLAEPVRRSRRNLSHRDCESTEVYIRQQSDLPSGQLQHSTLLVGQHDRAGAGADR